MLIPIFGPPTAFTQYCMHLIRVFADVKLQDVDYLAATELSRFQEIWGQRGRKHAVFFCDCPDADLANIFLSIKSPRLVLVEDPVDAIGFMMRERGLDWIWAARLEAQCVTSNLSLIADQYSMVINRSDSLNFSEFYRLIADCFNIALTDLDISLLLRRIDPVGRHSSNVSLEELLLNHMSQARPMGLTLVDVAAEDADALSPLVDYLRHSIQRDVSKSMIWPSRFFIPFDQPNQILRGALDMTGPARCLVYGPYLYLPVGNWSFEFEFNVVDNYSGNRLDVDCHYGILHPLDSFSAGAESRYIIRGELEAREPRDAVQFRVLMREGAIEGRLTMSDVNLRQI